MLNITGSNKKITWIMKTWMYRQTNKWNWLELSYSKGEAAWEPPGESTSALGSKAQLWISPNSMWLARTIAARSKKNKGEEITVWVWISPYSILLLMNGGTEVAKEVTCHSNQGETPESAKGKVRRLGKMDGAGTNKQLTNSKWTAYNRHIFNSLFLQLSKN